MRIQSINYINIPTYNFRSAHSVLKKGKGSVSFNIKIIQHTVYIAFIRWELI